MTIDIDALRPRLPRFIAMASEILWRIDHPDDVDSQSEPTPAGVMNLPASPLDGEPVGRMPAPQEELEANRG